MPSPSRDPKAVADWLELDYYRRARGLKRWRRLLSYGLLLGLLALVGASVAASLTRGYTSKIYQAAPVSPTHVAFNDDCAACHTQPFHTILRFSPFHASSHAVADAACKACHSDNPNVMATGTRPGPKALPHNAILLGERNCAECHREHRGRPLLARVPDGECLGCHQNLQEHRPAGNSAFLNVTGFPDGHPEISLWRGDHKGLIAGKDDPGRIHFNHQKHLALDDPRFLPGGKKLTCGQCHQPNESGRYMRPINHETHCQACHKGQRTTHLLGRFADPGDQQAAYDFAKELAPHQKPQDIRDHLNGRLLKFLALNPVGVGSGADLERPWPREKNEVVWTKFSGVMASFHRERFIPPQLHSLEAQLYNRSGGCAYCHEESSRSWPVGARPDDVLPEYEPPDIPKRWLRHATFDHHRHLMVDCVHCHQAETSSRTTDVLIPKQEVCASCHKPGGGARFDCAECHKYHGRESDRAEAHTFLFQGAQR